MGHNVIVWRYSELFRDAFKHDKHFEFEQDLDQAIKKSDAVVIATATDSHMQLIDRVIDADKHLYIEKPISHTFDLVEDYQKRIQKKKLIVEIGCQLRSHAGLIKLKQYIDEHDDGPLYTFIAVVGYRLDQWRPHSDYRKCYSSDKMRGGGSLFDLIHEIDLIIWFCGEVEEVFAQQSQISDQEINADDLTNIILKMKNRAVGQIQMDMLSPCYRRYLELVFQKAIYRWDYVTGNLVRTDSQNTQTLYSTDSDFSRNDLFLSHMSCFLDRINKNNKPRCSFDDGVLALKIACAASLSSKTHKKITI